MQAVWPTQLANCHVLAESVLLVLAANSATCAIPPMKVFEHSVVSDDASVTGFDNFKACCVLTLNGKSKVAL